MYFKQLLNERLGCASYLIASRQSQEAAIVDPSLDIDRYEALLRERGFRLRYVIDTHVHADHVSGGRELAARYGSQLCLHQSAAVTYPFRGLAGGEELELGQLRLRIVHTPGHRPELISILVVNPPRSPEPSMVLTGDSLLVGDVGRPDFGGGDPEAQYEGEIPPDRMVCTICRSGYRSLRAAQFLRQVGHEVVASVRGGMDAWERSGREIVCGAGGSERRHSEQASGRLQKWDGRPMRRRRGGLIMDVGTKR